jgi:hypothetical protein
MIENKVIQRCLDIDIKINKTTEGKLKFSYPEKSLQEFPFFIRGLEEGYFDDIFTDEVISILEDSND